MNAVYDPSNAFAIGADGGVWLASAMFRSMSTLQTILTSMPATMMKTHEGEQNSMANLLKNGWRKRA